MRAVLIFVLQRCKSVVALMLVAVQKGNLELSVKQAIRG